MKTERGFQLSAGLLHLGGAIFAGIIFVGHCFGIAYHFRRFPR